MLDTEWLLDQTETMLAEKECLLRGRIRDMESRLAVVEDEMHRLQCEVEKREYKNWIILGLSIILYLSATM